jgi:hypothetical protein
MSKTKTCLILLTAALLLALSSPCLAGTAGTFAKALKDRFCGVMSGPAWYGCFAYMHYRVDLVKNKNSAKSTCYKNGCGSKYGSGANFETCKTGCDKAYGADTQ